jgi:LysM repeat protein
MIVKKAVLISLGLMFSFMLSAARMNSEEVKSPAADSSSVNQNSSFSAGSIIESVIKYGKSFLYTPYHFGSSNGLSFDCSGFTSYIYNSFGYKLDHSSSGQASQFPAVDRRQLKVGDLVYFSGHRRSKNHIGHVGIVVSAKEDGTFEFMHAATSRGITISSSEEPYYAERYIKANRVVGSNPIIDGAACYKGDKLASEFSQVPFVEAMNQVSQKNPAKYHKVKKGESLKSIAKIYGVSVDKLMALNNLKRTKVSKGQQLKVKVEESVLVSEPIKKDPVLLAKQDDKKQSESPVATTNNDSKTSNPTTHTVKPKETFFSIAKLYNLTVEQLKSANHTQSTKVYVGQKINLVASTTLPASQTTPSATQTTSTSPSQSVHVVKKGETLFSIASLYKISVDDLQKLNKIDGSSIKSGQTIKVASIANDDNKSTEASSNGKLAVSESPSAKSKLHTVKKGETLFSIANDGGVSVEALMKLNSMESSKVMVGQSINVPATSSDELDKPTKKSELAPKIAHHSVTKGETYFSIAKKYGCTIDQLMDWNQKYHKKLFVGARLKIVQDIQ